VERVLAGVWAQVLGVDRVGVDDDFFALGGDSILAMRIAARARQAGLAVSPQALFGHPTVAALAAATQAVPAEPPPAAAAELPDAQVEAALAELAKAMEDPA
jgi:aryl carrier-like protein